MVPQEVSSARSILQFNQTVFGHVDPEIKSLVIADLQVALASATDPQVASAIRDEIGRIEA